jgi:hypothetical protein
MMDQDSPAAVERATVAAIEALRLKLLQYVHMFPVGASAPGIAAWLNGFEQLVHPLQALSPRADWLKNQGFPQASSVLGALFVDINGARTSYQQTYQSAVQHQQRGAQIVADANAYTARTIQDVNARQNAVFRKATDQWFDVWEKRCFDCHRIINVTGGGYGLECARRRGIIW